MPPEADLVCYWFVKAGQQIGLGKAHRAGLVATNSIRGGANRRALQTATEGCPIFDTRSDQRWVIDGAAVRVSLVCFSPSEDSHVPEVRLEVLLAAELSFNSDARHLGMERARRHCGTRVNARRRRQWRVVRLARQGHRRTSEGGRGSTDEHVSKLFSPNRRFKIFWPNFFTHTGPIRAGLSSMNRGLQTVSVFCLNSQVHRSHREYRGVPSWWGVGVACQCASCCMARRPSSSMCWCTARRDG